MTASRCSLRVAFSLFTRAVNQARLHGGAGGSALAGRVQFGRGLVEPALLDVHAGQVEVAVPDRVLAAERQQLRERLLGLLEVAALARPPSRKQPMP